MGYVTLAKRDIGGISFLGDVGRARCGDQNENKNLPGSHILKIIKVSLMPGNQGLTPLGEEGKLGPCGP